MNEIPPVRQGHESVPQAKHGHNRSAWIAALAALLLGLLLLAPATSVRATVTPGATTALVNVGQSIREASTAVPIVGITATSNSPADLMIRVDVSFSGLNFVPGNAGTLLALDTNPDRSGVALYRDVGTVPGALDPGDMGVTATGVSWVGSVATLTYAETFPAVAVGAFDWIVVIRTSTTAIASGNQIIATIPAGGIAFSGAVSQPAAAVTTAALGNSPTAVNDLLAPGTWIGPSSVAVHARAALGVKIVDGGIPTNYGIHDQLRRVVVQLFDDSRTFGATTFAPLSANPATSGVALYRDSDGNGIWDAADTGVTLTAVPGVDCVAPAAGALFDVCLLPNPEFLPHSLAGAAYSYFVVLRSGTGMSSGDRFHFEVLQSDGLSIQGVLGGDATRLAGLTDAVTFELMGDNTPPCLTPGCGVPIEPAWMNPTSSPYLFPFGHTLYFGHGMGATPVPGEIHLGARDAESGLGQVTFAAAPSLAGSPATQVLSGNALTQVFGNYSFNATSTAASSPVGVTVYDAVGNHATVFFNFILDAVSPTITPAPGWNNLVGVNPLGLSPLYVNATGTLWFSPWIVGTATADISVDLFDGTSSLRNATASTEPSLAGGPFYANPTSFGFGTFFFFGWTATYAFNVSSTDASHPVTIASCDYVANCASRAFDYRMDATPPVVTIVSPAAGSAVSGSIVVAARASDSGSGLAPPPLVEILGQTGFQPMIWNGSAWILPISTALYPDGMQRIVVTAFDNVGNQGVALVDVVFRNAVPSTPPRVVFAAPGAGAIVSGIVTVQVGVSDSFALAYVNLTVGASTYPMASLGNGVYAVSFGSTALPAGAVTLRVTATDVAGLSSSSSETVQVDNSPPAITLLTPSGDHGPITLTAQVADSPAGVASVTFIVDGTSYVGVNLGNGTYGVTITTSAAQNGLHAYAVVAVDRVGNTATKTGSFSVNTPPDYLGAAVNVAPLLIFLLLVVAFVLALLMVDRRRKGEKDEKKETVRHDPPPPAQPRTPEEEL